MLWWMEWKPIVERLDGMTTSLETVVLFSELTIFACHLQANPAPKMHSAPSKCETTAPRSVPRAVLAGKPPLRRQPGARCTHVLVRSEC